MKEEKRKKLSFGLRKFLRAEKARIRRTAADAAEAERRLAELAQKTFKP
jgi:hypothetical protein